MSIRPIPPGQRVPETICRIALVIFSGIAMGQSVPSQESQNGSTEARATVPGLATHAAIAAAAAGNPAAPAQEISYANGQLRINVSHSTLAEVLRKVAALTGVQIEIPDGANSEGIPILELGPGPARQIVASLLSDSNFDYLIQGSDADPEKIQSVLLLPRGKKDNAPDVPVRPGRYPNVRAAAPAQPEEVPAPEPTVTAQDQTAAPGANPSSPQPQQDQPTPTAQPDLTAPPVYGQPLQTNIPKTFPVAPPATMDQQTVSQQLLQMYQQRTQMMQQQRQTPGNN